MNESIDGHWTNAIQRCVNAALGWPDLLDADDAEVPLIVEQAVNGSESR